MADEQFSARRSQHSQVILSSFLFVPPMRGDRSRSVCLRQRCLPTALCLRYRFFFSASSGRDGRSYRGLPLQRCCFLIRRLFASSLKREGERVNASAENAGPRREASPTTRKFLMSAAIGGWTVRKRIVDSRSTSPPMQTAETRSLCTRTGESTHDKSRGENANKTGILLLRLRFIRLLRTQQNECPFCCVRRDNVSRRVSFGRGGGRTGRRK